MVLIPPDGDDDGCENEHKHSRQLHDGGDVDRAERVTSRHRVCDFVQGCAGCDAQLGVSQSGKRSKCDFHEGEDRAHDGDDGHGHHFIVGFLVFLFRWNLDGSGKSHDGCGTTNAGTASHQNGQLRVNAELTGDVVAHDDGERHHNSGNRQAFDALREQHLQVELESEQNNTQAEQLVGNQSCCVFHTGLMLW